MTLPPSFLYILSLPKLNVKTDQELIYFITYKYGNVRYSARKEITIGKTIRHLRFPPGPPWQY